MSGILITRPAAQSVTPATRIQAAGFKVFLAPLLDIAPTPWQLPDIAPQAILITSANAAAALANTALSRDIPVYAVGDRTAADVRQQGFTRVESAAGDARALFELVEQRCSHGLGALLYLTGEAVAGNLAAQLNNAGFWVETRIVYRANATTALPEEVKQALLAGEITGVMLYSPRSAAIFSRLLGSLAVRSKLSLFCLSSAIAQAAGNDWQAVTISPKPDEDSLIESLLNRADML